MQICNHFWIDKTKRPHLYKLNHVSAVLCRADPDREPPQAPKVERSVALSLYQYVAIEYRDSKFAVILRRCCAVSLSTMVLLLLHCVAQITFYSVAAETFKLPVNVRPLMPPSIRPRCTGCHSAPLSSMRTCTAHLQRVPRDRNARPVSGMRDLSRECVTCHRRVGAGAALPAHHGGAVRRGRRRR